MFDTYRETYNVCRFVNASNIPLGKDDILLKDRSLNNKENLINLISLTLHSIKFHCCKYMFYTYVGTYSLGRFVNASNIPLGNEDILFLFSHLNNIYII
jgi:hypothetical protein